MPLYRYKCKCGATIEAFRTIDKCEDSPVCHGKTKLMIVPTMISVFTPYKTVAWDKEQGKPLMIRSKREHNQFLKRNGYEEVGNDKSMAPKSREEIEASRQECRDDPQTPVLSEKELKEKGWIEENL